MEPCRARKSKWGQDIGPSDLGDPSSPAEEIMAAEPSSPKSASAVPQEESSKTKRRCGTAQLTGHVFYSLSFPCFRDTFP